MNPLLQLKKLALPMVFFSLFSNLTVLVSPIFMMQVLDRVVPSGNISTLAMLLVVALGILGTHGVIEYFRDVSLARTKRWIETVGARAAVRTQGPDRQKVIQDVGLLTQFFASGLATTAMNLPFAPLFLLALLLIHPYFAVLALVLVAAIVVVRAVCFFLTRDNVDSADRILSAERTTLEDVTDQQLVVGIRTIFENLSKRYYALQKQRHGFEEETSRVVNVRLAALNFLRTSAQLLSLSLGAFLVVRGELSSGGMIGASIVSAKVISTLEGGINSWGGIRQFSMSFSGLGKVLETSETPLTEIDALGGALSANGLISPRGAGAPPRLDRISFQIGAGECLAIVGDSGSGKTTLLHALCGIDPTPIGSVFLDESELRTLGPQTFTEEIGYLPQQARLVKGTLAENISCFDQNPTDTKIIKAARIAGVHGLISALPQAYKTDMGATPYLLSAGQKQRVALARAIYQSPRYLFLDEPNALLDAAGERQLCDTLAALKAQGTTIVMVLHRSGIMGLADKVLLLDNGKMADFGPRSEVLGRMSDGKQRLKLPLNAASVQDLNDWIVAQFSRHSDREFCLKAAMIGTELFNAACLNGPNDVSRNAIITFRFESETLCELVLREERTTEAAEKMPKIRSLITHPEVSMIDLPSDEIALAVVAQLSDRLEVENFENASLFSAVLSSERSKTQGAVSMTGKAH